MAIVTKPASRRSAKPLAAVLTLLAILAALGAGAWFIFAGGSGVVPLTRAPDGRWTATRDIVLRP